MSKKGQLRIQEMSFMLVAVFIFFVLVGLFVINIIGSNLRAEARNIQEAKTLSAVINLANSPEFSCVDSRAGCVDADKIVGLMKSSLYRNFWDFSSLVVLRESGFDKGEGELVDCSDDLSNFENCDKFEIFNKKVSNKEKISSFVALCWIEEENYVPYEKCEVGKLVVGVEVRG